jgi:hypothetical protein
MSVPPRISLKTVPLLLEKLLSVGGQFCYECVKYQLLVKHGKLGKFIS